MGEKCWKQIPNIITAFRILGSLLMMFLEVMSLEFYVVYTLCGLSDVVDGCVARKFKIQSTLGATLDSIADLLFYAVMLLKTFPIWAKILPVYFYYLLVAIFVVRLSSYIVAWIKYHKFASIHTYMNKLTGLCVFLIPYVLGTNFFLGVCNVVCVIAILASTEELIIHFLRKECKRDCKSIFLIKQIT